MQTTGLGTYRVHSQSGDREYSVHVHVDDSTGWLMRARCTCPDWHKMSRALEGWIEGTGQSPHPGISHIDYSAVCKHCLAVLLETGAIE
ncbi:MAG: hypothetical protein GWN58_19640 [Anaerolineae bacterium]|nr:hypothetical protein [Anaerolineae bacterium]